MTNNPGQLACPVCPRTFQPRTNGGKPQVYCSPPCGHRHRKARVAYAAKLEAAGLVTTQQVLAALDDPPADAP